MSSEQILSELISLKRQFVPLLKSDILQGLKRFLYHFCLTGEKLYEDHQQ